MPDHLDLLLLTIVGGVIVWVSYLWHDEPKGMAQCPKCDGWLYVDGEPCDLCNFSGYIKE